jgi:hypothetical protein
MKLNENENENSPFNFDALDANDPFAPSETSELNTTELNAEKLNFAELNTSELNTDQPEPINIIDPVAVTVDTVDPGRLMECVCPKCAQKTEVDLALMSENGFVTTCQSCKKEIHVIRESCACRARRRAHEINCVYCGKQLDHHAHCHSCAKPFPDYFVTVNPDAARSKARSEFFQKKLAAIRDLNFSFKPTFSRSSKDAGTKYSPTSKTSIAAQGKSKPTTQRYAVLAISLIVVIVLAAGGTFAYNSYKSGQLFAENYIKALYCIKTGVDTNLKTSASMKTEWETAALSGRSLSPSISSKDEAKAVKLRSEVDKNMQKISEPPKKFSQANNSLMEVHKIYLETEALIASKPKSLPEFSSSIDNLEKKMSQTSQSLKSNLPDALKQELEKAKLKYRGLTDF